jgi:hypothetical protein
VPFFEKLKTNGGPTHFDLSKVLPGATCTVAVTVVKDATKPWEKVTFTQRDLPLTQDLRPKVADRGGTVSWDLHNPPELLSNAPGGTWSGDCRLYDRDQPGFLVYRQSGSQAFGSVPTSSSSPGPAAGHAQPTSSAGASRSSSPSP